MIDDKTVVVGISGQAEVILSRCTIKLLFTAKDSAYKDCVNKLKEVFYTF